MKTILVTGSHRSGSSWLGKVVSSAKGVNYVHEPFNIGRYKNSPFNFWFEHINSKTSIEQQKKVKNYLLYFYSIFHKKSIVDIFRAKSYLEFRKVLSNNKSKFIKRTLLKDPIAIMSAEWIYENLDSDMIVIIRHPAAFVASLKVKNWEFDFNNYLNQPNLMNTYLKDYSELITEYSTNKKDIIKQGILLWNTIHAIIYYYKEKYEHEWYFVKHEDLSLEPLKEFEKIFNFLKIPYNQESKNFIVHTSQSENNTSLNRESVKNIKTWQNRLKSEEIMEIKEGTKEVWTKFYNETDW